MLLLYALCYNPTLALVNAIAFNQMASPEKQFPTVRLFGTIGWIVAGLIVGWLKVEPTATPLLIATRGLAGVRRLRLPAAAHAAQVARAQGHACATCWGSTRCRS